MKATIKGDKLILELDFDPKGELSKTGKTLIHASTRGNDETTVKVNGKNLVVGLNAYTYVKDKAA